MKYLLLIILFVIGLSHLSAQDLEARLQINDKVDCSVYAENSSELIGTYDIFQLDSVKAVLDIWERECGKSEPIMRLQILHDIYQGNFESEGYIDYYDQYVRKYIYRIEAAKRTTVRSNYESSKTYYDHTQIGNGFDKHTLTLAQLLLDQQDEGSDAYLICLLFVNEFEKFKELAYYKSAANTPLLKSLYDSRTGIFSNFRISFGLGAWIPIGNNKNIFGISPMISLGMHQPINRNWRMDGVFTIVPFINNEALDFRFEGKDEVSNSLVALNINMGLTRVNQLSPSLFLDTGFSIGLNILNTGIDNPKEESSDHGITTIDLGAKVALRHKFKKGTSIALQSSINYAPYNWSGNLKSEVGKGYASVGLVYGF